MREEPACLSPGVPRVLEQGAVSDTVPLTAHACTCFAVPLSWYPACVPSRRARRAQASGTGAAPGAARASSAQHKERRRMRKEDIVRRIAEETACTHAQGDEAVEAILATLKQTLQQGDAVILRRFG